MWATLQFRWVQLQYPVVALAFERLLLCGSLPVAAMALAWGAMAAVGAGQAPFYLAVLLVGAPRAGANPARRAHCSHAPAPRSSMGAGRSSV